MKNPAHLITAAQDDLHALAALFIEYTNRHLFITGKAGTGKTTFLKTITRNTRKRHVVLAPTGIAAINAEGTTLNAFFQIPPSFYVPTESHIDKLNFSRMADIVQNLNYSTLKKDLIRKLDLIIIDEISMIRADQLDLLNIILQQLRQNTKPFGNIQMVFIGDLLQLPPVLRNEDALTYRLFYSSPFFFNAEVIIKHPPLQIEFSKVYRQSNEEFIEMLNQIRTNAVTDETLALLNQRYSVDFSKENLPDYITITSHNGTAEAINLERLNALPGIEHIYEGTITGDFKDTMLPMDKILKLKIDAQVMFIRNDSGESRRYFNGKVGKISSISPDQIKVTFSDNVEIILEKACWFAFDYNMSADNNNVKPVQVGEFSQYPIKLAWAVTIHKSQGLTFEKAIIDAADSFETGQVYVALSRVRNLESLTLRSKITRQSIQANSEVISFHALLNKEPLEKMLREGEYAFLLDRLFEKISLKPVIYILDELFSKPETFKQKIHTGSFIRFADILPSVKNLEEIIGRFRQEISEVISDQSKHPRIFTRFEEAKAYLTKQIVNFCTTKLSEIVNVVSNSKAELQTKIYLEKLQEALTHQQEGMAFAVSIIQQLSAGLPPALLLEKWNTPKIETNSSPAIKAKTRLKNAINKSLKETIDLINSGKKIDEIATMRNLSIGTIEGHVLEGIKGEMIEANKIINSKRLDTITSAIATIGNNVFDVKEYLGATYSFFEIRIGINQTK